MQQLLSQAETLAEKGETFAEKFGNYLVDGFQLLALFVIGATVVWSAADTYVGLLGKPSATVDDILLLFIFLELGAMVGIYFKTNRLPVQFLLYVAITVLTRSLASSVSVKHMPDERLLAISGGIVLLAIAVFVLRYAAYRLEPFVSHVESDDPQPPSKEKAAR